MNDDLIPLLIPVAFIVIGSIVTWVGLRQRRRGIESLSWPTVTGRIVSSGVESAWSRTDSTSNANLVYFPVIRYEYTIGERRYTGEGVKAGGEVRTASRARAEKTAARYPAGSEVTVYHDPRDHAEALLEPGVKAGVRMLIGFGLFFAAAGILLLFLLLR